MNISSVIVRVDEFYWDKVILELQKLKDAEICICDKKMQAIIVAISALDTKEELQCLKTIEALKGVKSANMHYSYSEQDLSKQLLAQEIAQNLDTPKDAKEIRYKGSIQNWLED